MEADLINYVTPIDRAETKTVFETAEATARKTAQARGRTMRRIGAPEIAGHCNGNLSLEKMGGSGTAEVTDPKKSRTRSVISPYIRLSPRVSASGTAVKTDAAREEAVSSTRFRHQFPAVGVTSLSAATTESAAVADRQVRQAGGIKASKFSPSLARVPNRCCFSAVSISITVVESSLETPLRRFDACTAPLSGTRIWKIPLIRIYGVLNDVPPEMERVLSVQSPFPHKPASEKEQVIAAAVLSRHPSTRGRHACVHNLTGAASEYVAPASASSDGIFAHVSSATAADDLASQVSPSNISDGVADVLIPRAPNAKLSSRSCTAAAQLQQPPACCCLRGHSCCAVVHGVLPYFFVPVPLHAHAQPRSWLRWFCGRLREAEEVLQQSQRSQRFGKPTAALTSTRNDKCLSREHQVPADSGNSRSFGAFSEVQAKQPVIYDVQLVWRRSIYGYDHVPRLFAQIFTLQPGKRTSQLAALLLQGTLTGGLQLQPFEVHIPYKLQFFADYNLRGMSLMTVKNPFFVAPLVLPPAVLEKPLLPRIASPRAASEWSRESRDNLSRSFVAESTRTSAKFGSIFARAARLRRPSGVLLFDAWRQLWIMLNNGNGAENKQHAAGSKIYLDARKAFVDPPRGENARDTHEDVSVTVCSPALLTRGRLASSQRFNNVGAAEARREVVRRPEEAQTACTSSYSNNSRCYVGNKPLHSRSKSANHAGGIMWSKSNAREICGARISGCSSCRNRCCSVSISANDNRRNAVALNEQCSRHVRVLNGVCRKTACEVEFHLTAAQIMNPFCQAVSTDLANPIQASKYSRFAAASDQPTQRIPADAAVARPPEQQLLPFVRDYWREEAARSAALGLRFPFRDYSLKVSSPRTLPQGAAGDMQERDKEAAREAVPQIYKDMLQQLLERLGLFSFEQSQGRARQQEVLMQRKPKQKHHREQRETCTYQEAQTHLQETFDQRLQCCGSLEREAVAQFASPRKQDFEDVYHERGPRTKFVSNVMATSEASFTATSGIVVAVPEVDSGVAVAQVTSSSEALPSSTRPGHAGEILLSSTPCEPAFQSTNSNLCFPTVAFSSNRQSEASSDKRDTHLSVFQSTPPFGTNRRGDGWKQRDTDGSQVHFQVAKPLLTRSPTRPEDGSMINSPAAAPFITAGFDSNDCMKLAGATLSNDRYLEQGATINIPRVTLQNDLQLSREAAITNAACQMRSNLSCGVSHDIDNKQQQDRSLVLHLSQEPPKPSAHPADREEGGVGYIESPSQISSPISKNFRTNDESAVNTAAGLKSPLQQHATPNTSFYRRESTAIEMATAPASHEKMLCIECPTYDVVTESIDAPQPAQGRIVAAELRSEQPQHWTWQTSTVLDDLHKRKSKQNQQAIRPVEVSHICKQPRKCVTVGVEPSHESGQGRLCSSTQQSIIRHKVDRREECCEQSKALAVKRHFRSLSTQHRDPSVCSLKEDITDTRKNANERRGREERKLWLLWALRRGSGSPKRRNELDSAVALGRRSSSSGESGYKGGDDCSSDSSLTRGRRDRKYGNTNSVSTVQRFSSLESKMQHAASMQGCSTKQDYSRLGRFSEKLLVNRELSFHTEQRSITMQEQRHEYRVGALSDVRRSTEVVKQVTTESPSPSVDANGTNDLSASCVASRALKLGPHTKVESEAGRQEMSAALQFMKHVTTAALESGDGCAERMARSDRGVGAGFDAHVSVLPARVDSRDEDIGATGCLFSSTSTLVLSTDEREVTSSALIKSNATSVDNQHTNSCADPDSKKVTECYSATVEKQEMEVRPGSVDGNSFYRNSHQEHQPVLREVQEKLLQDDNRLQNQCSQQKCATAEGEIRRLLQTKNELLPTVRTHKAKKYQHFQWASDLSSCQKSKFRVERQRESDRSVMLPTCAEALDRWPDVPEQLPFYRDPRDAPSFFCAADTLATGARAIMMEQQQRKLNHVQKQPQMLQEQGEGAAAVTTCETERLLCDRRKTVVSVVHEKKDRRLELNSCGQNISERRYRFTASDEEARAPNRKAGGVLSRLKVNGVFRRRYWPNISDAELEEKSQQRPRQQPLTNSQYESACYNNVRQFVSSITPVFEEDRCKSVSAFPDSQFKRSAEWQMGITFGKTGMEAEIGAPEVESLTEKSEVKVGNAKTGASDNDVVSLIFYRQPPSAEQVIQSCGPAVRKKVVKGKYFCPLTSPLQTYKSRRSAYVGGARSVGCDVVKDGCSGSVVKKTSKRLLQKERRKQKNKKNSLHSSTLAAAVASERTRPPLMWGTRMDNSGRIVQILIRASQSSRTIQKKCESAKPFTRRRKIRKYKPKEKEGRLMYRNTMQQNLDILTSSRVRIMSSRFHDRCHRRTLSSVNSANVKQYGVTGKTINEKEPLPFVSSDSKGHIRQNVSERVGKSRAQQQTCLEFQPHNFSIETNTRSDENAALFTSGNQILVCADKGCEAPRAAKISMVAVDNLCAVKPAGETTLAFNKSTDGGGNSIAVVCDGSTPKAVPAPALMAGIAATKDARTGRDRFTAETCSSARSLEDAVKRSSERNRCCKNHYVCTESFRSKFSTGESTSLTNASNNNVSSASFLNSPTSSSSNRETQLGERNVVTCSTSGSIPSQLSVDEEVREALRKRRPLSDFAPFSSQFGESSTTACATDAAAAAVRDIQGNRLTYGALLVLEVFAERNENSFTSSPWSDALIAVAFIARDEGLQLACEAHMRSLKDAEALQVQKVSGRIETEPNGFEVTNSKRTSWHENQQKKVDNARAKRNKRNGSSNLYTTSDDGRSALEGPYQWKNWQKCQGCWRNTAANVRKVTQEKDVDSHVLRIECREDANDANCWIHSDLSTKTDDRISPVCRRAMHFANDERDCEDCCQTKGCTCIASSASASVEEDSGTPFPKVEGAKRRDSDGEGIAAGRPDRARGSNTDVLHDAGINITPRSALRQNFDAGGIIYVDSASGTCPSYLVNSRIPAFTPSSSSSSSIELRRIESLCKGMRKGATSVTQANSSEECCRSTLRTERSLPRPCSFADFVAYWRHRHPIVRLDEQLQAHIPRKTQLFPVKNERDLLRKLSEILNIIDPSLVFQWGSSAGLGVEYLLRRADFLGCGFETRHAFGRKFDARLYPSPCRETLCCSNLNPHTMDRLGASGASGREVELAALHDGSLYVVDDTNKLQDIGDDVFQSFWKEDRSSEPSVISGRLVLECWDLLQQTVKLQQSSLEGVVQEILGVNFPSVPPPVLSNLWNKGQQAQRRNEKQATLALLAAWKAWEQLRIHLRRPQSAECSVGMTGFAKKLQQRHPSSISYITQQLNTEQSKELEGEQVAHKLDEVARQFSNCEDVAASESLTWGVATMGAVLKYLLGRVRTILAMIDATELIPRNAELARLYGCDFFSALTRGSQFKVESVMLRATKQLGYLFASPSQTQVTEQQAPLCIPLVLEPQSGFCWSPVLVLDFQSLYPSIMIAHNICFSTALGSVGVDPITRPVKTFGVVDLHVPSILFRQITDLCRCNNMRHSLLERVENLQRKCCAFVCGGFKERETAASCIEVEDANLREESSNIHKSTGNTGINVLSNGGLFVTREVRQGIFPQVLNDILRTRIMLKEAMKQYKGRVDERILRLLDYRQFGLKMIANVSYGYTAASFTGHMPCAEVADAIVQTARTTLTRAIRLVESSPRWGGRVLYGDTDSLFVLVENKSLEAAFQIGREIANAVTEQNPFPVELQLEKVFLPCCLVSKKRYVGNAYTSPIAPPVFEAKGIESVRRDQCECTRSILESTLRKFFATRDLSEVKLHLCRQWTKILSRQMSLKPFIFYRKCRLGTYKAELGQAPSGSLPPQARVVYERLRAMLEKIASFGKPNAHDVFNKFQCLPSAKRLAQSLYGAPTRGERVPFVYADIGNESPYPVLARKTSSMRLLDCAVAPENVDGGSRGDKREQLLLHGCLHTVLRKPPFQIRELAPTREAYKKNSKIFTHGNCDGAQMPTAQLKEDFKHEARERLKPEKRKIGQGRQSSFINVNFNHTTRLRGFKRAIAMKNTDSQTPQYSQEQMRVLPLFTMYYILKQIIPALERIFGLLPGPTTVDLSGWFFTLHKTHGSVARIFKPSYAQQHEKRGASSLHRSRFNRSPALPEKFISSHLQPQVCLASRSNVSHDHGLLSEQHSLLNLVSTTFGRARRGRSARLYNYFSISVCAVCGRRCARVIVSTRTKPTQKKTADDFLEHSLPHNGRREREKSPNLRDRNCSIDLEAADGSRGNRIPSIPAPTCVPNAWDENIHVPLGVRKGLGMWSGDGNPLQYEEVVRTTLSSMRSHEPVRHRAPVCDSCSLDVRGNLCRLLLQLRKYEELLIKLEALCEKCAGNKLCSLACSHAWHCDVYFEKVRMERRLQDITTILRDLQYDNR